MDKKTIDFLKVVEEIKKTEIQEMKEGFQLLRNMYLELRDAGFTMEEAMSFIAALCKPPPNGDRGENGTK